MSLKGLAVMRFRLHLGVTDSVMEVLKRTNERESRDRQRDHSSVLSYLRKRDDRSTYHPADFQFFLQKPESGN